MNESEMAGYVGNYSQDPENPKPIIGAIERGGKLLLKGSSGQEVSVERIGENYFAIVRPGRAFHNAPLA